jgi:peptide/nickel transport system permease protein
MSTVVLTGLRSTSPTWQRFRDAFRRHPTAIAGGVVLAAMVLIAVLAPWLGTVDPQALSPIQRLKPPSSAHWFGSDMLGRDVYSRVIYGSRISLTVGIAVAALSRSRCCWAWRRSRSTSTRAIRCCSA